MDNYCINESPKLEFFSSGCCLLDKVLGGGYPLGRVVNVVGDRSSGKTLLAIEASANFAKKFETGEIYYDEVESAFDKSYAKTLGLPLDRVRFPQEEILEKSINKSSKEAEKDLKLADTVEGMFARLEHIANTNDANNPILYIVDSLDALTDMAEKDRSIEEGTFGLGKQKQLGAMFRRIVRKLEAKNITLFVISQIRQKIGVTFGEKYSVSGGKALEFYASIRLWLSEKGKIKRTVGGVERIYGIDVIAKCKKNKIGMPFRHCEFPIIFGYGIDDVISCVSFLKEVKKLDAIGMTERATSTTMLRSKLEKMSDEDFNDFREKVSCAASEAWDEIESNFSSKRKKY